MTRKELLYLLILLPERAKWKGDLSGGKNGDPHTHFKQSRRTVQAARRGPLMGVTWEFGLLPGAAFEASRGSFSNVVSAANR